MIRRAMLDEELGQTMEYIARAPVTIAHEVMRQEPAEELTLEGGRAEASRRADTVTRDTAGMQSSDRDAASAQYFDTVPPVEAEDYPWAHAAAVQEDVPPPDRDPPPRPDWHAPYEALWRDWSELIERVRQAGEPLFYAKGYIDMIPRIQALAENLDIAAGTRAPMIEALENHQRDLSARKHVEDCLDAAERHIGTHASLQRVADGLGVGIVKVSDHLGWRQEADRLTAAAEAILADSARYGSHLDNMETGRARVEGELSRLRHIVREDGEYASAVKKPEPHGESADTREKVEQPEPAKPAWMPAYEALRQDWNSLIEDARQAGMPSFYANGYIDIIPRIRELTENPDIPAKSRAPLIQVLENHQRYLSTRKHILDYPGEAERQMDARASLQHVAADQEIELTSVPAYPEWRQEAAERGVAVPDHEDYDTWRNVTDFAVGRCEGLMDDPVNYGIHLDYIALREESLGSALTRVRDVLEDDDRHLAATLAGQREGESPRMREERIARLLDDPEKLRELRQQRAERKAEKQQQSKGRYWSMRI